MSDRIGGLVVWALFMFSLWFWARPALIFVAAVSIMALVLWRAIRNLEGQSYKSYRKGS